MASDHETDASLTDPLRGWRSPPVTRRACARSTARSSSRSTRVSGGSCSRLPGPGYLVAVGYMDPGNWATDLAGRRALRLHAAQRDPHLQPDGDPAAGARRQARHRQRTRSRAGVPRQLLEAGDDRAVDPLRDRDRRLRSRRGHRRGDRAQPAVRPAADLGRLHHGARRAHRAVPAAQGIPLRRSAGRRADRRDRRVASRSRSGGRRPIRPRSPSASFRAQRS